MSALFKEQSEVDVADAARRQLIWSWRG